MQQNLTNLDLLVEVAAVLSRRIHVPLGDCLLSFQWSGKY